MTCNARLHVVDNYEALSSIGVRFILDELERCPDLLLCVASGGSPLGVYRELGRAYNAKPSAFAQLRVIKLDEWGPLSADDPASCEYYVRHEVVEPLRVGLDRFFTLAGDAADPEAECRRYAGVLERVGPVGLSVLGMGVNGHLGLNEPADWLHDSVHVADLAPTSHNHGMLAQAHTPPTHGLTLGIGDILRARRILLLVNGAHKRDAMRQFLSKRITTQFPASLLWLHPDLTIICDRAANPDE